MRCVGIDGESIAPWGYCLLSASSGSRLSEERRLTTRECCEFILGLAEPGSRLFGYGIGYDVCHWVADLSDAHKTRLATKGSVQFFDGPTCYRMVYRPNAYFSVSRLAGGPGSKSIKTATVVDLMRWHRRPFVDVCEEWDLLASFRAEWMREMKANREDLASVSTFVDAYNHEETECIAKLGEEMTSRLSDLGIPVSHPFTSGAVAGALMARNRVQDHWQPAPEVSDAVSRAFFGGREQCSRYGYFRDVTQWDIRSAYGWAMTQLPDILGEWHRANSPHCESAEWALLKVQWDIDEGKHPVMPFPWRAEDGRVHYPPRGTGWHWSPIVRSALRHYPDGEIRILDAWHYIPSSTSRPFGYIDGLFRSRRDAGDDPVASLLKSIIVATWGRMCSPGLGRPCKTRGMLDWAGMTTALIQERMLDAIHLSGEKSFISCCVDGFWTTNNQDCLGKDETLGGWSASTANDLLLLRPACYWKRTLSGPASEGGQGDVSSGWTAHTAGIPGGGGIVNDALREWNGNGWRRGRIDLTQRRVKGLLACSADGDYDQLGQFVDLPLSVAFNPGMGRMGHECPTMKHGDGWRRWLPYWPPKASFTPESASFQSRTGLVDDRWKERQEANAIEETSD